MEELRHDIIVDGKYKKRCYCQKCTKSYDDWKHRNKKEGCTKCKRRCYTVCEIQCEKPVEIVHEWGYKKKYEGKWESYKEPLLEIDVPKKDVKRRPRSPKKDLEYSSESSDSSNYYDEKKRRRNRKKCVSCNKK